MTFRPPVSLLIACALLLPAPFARGERENPAAQKPESGESRAADQGEADKKDSEKPADDASSVESMEARANDAYENGQYTQALPLFQKLKERYKDQPDKLKTLEAKIETAQKKLAEQLEKEGKMPPPGAGGTPGQPPVAPVGPPSDEERKPHPAPKSAAPYAVSIQELGNFRFDQEKGGNIPKDVQALSGSMVRLTGFMIPLDQANKIRQFVLVPDLFACCFGQPPQVQHSVIVTCPEGKAVSYFPDQIQVEGKLTVEEKKDDGYIVSIFEIHCTSVKPAPK
jgi:hypothetical protein